ncbi:MAG: GGDEF domain-containing protein [Anaeroplasmataceae bacterium]
MAENAFFVNKTDKFDSLTGLYRRERMFEYIEYLISHNIPFSYAILDVDNFKNVNDTYGHLFGDLVLKTIANELLGIVKHNGVIGRYGGDEFMLVFENVVDYDEQWRTCFDILKSEKTLTNDEVANFTWTYTIGMAKFPFDADEVNDLLELADKALYRGKVKGRNCFIIYLEEKHKEICVTSKREQVYTPMNLHAKLYNDIIRTNDIENNINEVFKFIGTYLMIDQICIENNNEITNCFIHPLAKKQTSVVLGDELLRNNVRNNVGIFYDNATLESKVKNSNLLVKKMIENDIMATAIVELKAFEKTYGFLRADMVVLDTGRIWQQTDLTVLLELAHIIALNKYINDLKNEKAC